MGSALQNLARAPWTKFRHAWKPLQRNARTYLSTSSSHRSPRPVWKTIGAVDKKPPRPETPAAQCSRPLVHTKFPLLSTRGVHKQQGPPMAGLVVHVLRYRDYNALPPNLWVYCRLIARPTLSNQDTS